MAIHSAQILSNLLVQFFNKKISNRQSLEEAYIKEWKLTFQKRLRAGHFLNLFLSNANLLNLGIPALRLFPKLLPTIIRQTHGEK